MAARLVSAFGVALLVLASATGFDRAEAGQNSWTVTGPSVAGMLWRLAVDPTRTATVYAAGSTGSGTAVAPRVFKTIDAGANWSEITNGIVNIAVNALAVDPSAATTRRRTRWRSTAAPTAARPGRCSAGRSAAATSTDR